MGYLKDLDQWFAEVLKHVPVDQLAPIERAFKEKILESFKNGIVAGKLSMGKKQTTSHV